MRLLLAPMEGVVDAPMRKILTEIGGIDYCATEFIRVTDRMVPKFVIERYCPELATDGKTETGVPVYCQFLGSDPHWMGENAVRAVEMGALGIDLNFGCPAKRVNQHEGGAVLLKSPDKLYRIISAVRAKVPSHIPVTTKIRLGFHTPELAIENAKAAEAANSTWLTVHARTRDEGYKPPAHWDWLGKIRSSVRLPVIANGDVWSVEDYQRCLEVSGCTDVMLGRGIIARPDLARQIKQFQQPIAVEKWAWEKVHALVPRLIYGEGKLDRVKQWTKLMGRTYPEAEALFQQIKRCQHATEIRSLVPT